MSRGRGTGHGTFAPVADVFAGTMVALLLLLLVVWLEALIEANEIRKLRKMQQIFDTAFSTLTSTDPDILIDKDTGQITLKARQLFQSGKWTFAWDKDDRIRFERTRGKLAGLLHRIDQDFADSPFRDEFSAQEHLEVRIIGHTDCESLSAEGWLQDNWDLAVLRAAALARYFTETCDDGGLECCPDGSDRCEEGERSRRVNPRWRVLPAGRGKYQPILHNKEEEGTYEDCDASARELLERQRRVVIEIVPRTDMFILRDQ